MNKVKLYFTSSGSLMLIAIIMMLNGSWAAPEKAVVNPSNWIIGKWKMVTVLEGNQDITPLLNPEDDRWIEFKQDLTFESGGGPGHNSGTYSIDDQAGSLHLDSDAGPGDDSNWRLQFRDDLLYMRGIGTNRQEMTTIINKRVSE